MLTRANTWLTRVTMPQVSREDLRIWHVVDTCDHASGRSRRSPHLTRGWHVWPCLR